VNGTAVQTPELVFGGERLRLLPQRAALLPAQGWLLVADAHLGKAHSFRRLGVPVPGGTTAETLQRLHDAVAASGAVQVVFLGDLLHAARGVSAAVVEAFARWREAHAAVALTLVRGNHDRGAGDPPAAWGVLCVDEPLAVPGAGGLLLAHHPTPRDDAAVLAGHLHPAVRLGGRAHDRLRLPCFHFRGSGPGAVGVLPAFGAFTGSHVVQPGPGDRVYVVAAEVVHAVPMPA
jgi:DNA ligase-associated metallophosphoesterase